MPDLTIPDAAVEAAAKADYERWRHPNAPAWEDADEGVVRQRWRDTESVPLAAAAPHIAAQALEDFADAHRMPWTMFLREDGSPVTVGDLMRETAARYRIEATNG